MAAVELGISKRLAGVCVKYFSLWYHEETLLKTHMAENFLSPIKVSGNYLIFV